MGFAGNGDAITYRPGLPVDRLNMSFARHCCREAEEKIVGQMTIA
jgi:hypothetical protein